MLRDNLVGLIEPMRNSAGVDPLALGIQKQASDERPPCLENPLPARAESPLTENAASPFQAEPTQAQHQVGAVSILLLEVAMLALGLSVFPNDSPGRPF
jgi:hypothetical protein